MPGMAARRHSAGRGASLRIIAGRWRGRRIPLPGDAPVRPTGDRIRETLFNWLMPVVHDARCLDLFAGTGALGLEALSRGAASATFVERDAGAAENLYQSLERFGARNAVVHCADALRYLQGTPGAFDIVFLDPPFDGGDFENLCTLLDNGWLAPEARVYMEMSRDRAVPVLPEGWSVMRDRKAGKVRYLLAVAGDATGRRQTAHADRRDVSGDI